MLNWMGFAVSFLSLSSSVEFYLGLFWELFVKFNSISWSGLLVSFESYVKVMVFHLAIFVGVLICLSERSSALLSLSKCTVWLSVMFFGTTGKLMFYMFYELTILPVVFMVVLYGSQVEKISALYYLAIYTVICSFPFLFLMLSLLSFSAFLPNHHTMYIKTEKIYFLLLMFLVKLPVYGLHLWLPKAHVEAPTKASVLLAGLMLKLGGVGLLRVLSLTKMVNPTPLLFPCFLGLLFAPFLCSSQVDHKSFAAYSSVTHMNSVALAKFVCGGLGESYSVMLLISHGYISSFMFVYIGSFYHSNMSRMILYFEGVKVSSMGFVSLFSVVMLSNKAVPPFISFWSELFLLGSFYSKSCWQFYKLLIYFMFSFYYNVFLVCHKLGGKSVSLSLSEKMSLLLPVKLILVSNLMLISFLT